MPSELETRIYLSAMAIILAITILTVSYMDGRVAESVHRDRDAQTEIATERHTNAVLQARYDALANETDPVTIMSAELHYQQARAGQ
jgi:hypothetical protein